MIAREIKELCRSGGNPMLLKKGKTRETLGINTILTETDPGLLFRCLASVAPIANNAAFDCLINVVMLPIVLPLN